MMMSKGRNTPDDGFTLLEVLVAVFLLALILGSVYSAFFVIHDATSATTGTVVRLQEARATMDLMRRELEAAMGNHPVEVRDRDSYGSQTSVLIFDTNGSALAGGSRVGYSVKEAEGGGLSLIKTVGPVNEGIVTVSGEAVEVEAVEDVVSFMVEAKNRGKWIKTWRESAWPDDIRVTLTIKLHGAEVPLVFTTRPYVGKVL
jgi:prepilin-type N-terminal cleavage/methylation domain-containing protein